MVANGDSFSIHMYLIRYNSVCGIAVHLILRGLEYFANGETPEGDSLNLSHVLELDAPEKSFLGCATQEDC